MKITRRRIILLLLIPIIGTVAFFAARSFVFSRIQSAIEKSLKDLESSGLKIHYQTLSVDWNTNQIRIDQLLLETSTADTACIHPEFVSILKIQADGFNLFPIIFNQELRFDALHIDGLKTVIRQNSQLKTTGSGEDARSLTFTVDRTVIRSADITYTDSIDCHKISGIKSDLVVEGLTLDFQAGESFAYAINSVSLTDTEVMLPQALYTFEIKEAKMDVNRQKLRIDSITVIPHEDKVAFGNRKGFEIDRYDAIIPFFELSDLSFALKDSVAITAGMADIQFFLKVFRDKRHPFIKKQKLLPIDQLRALPFALRIDSLKIRKSYVKYEEFAEGSSEAGSVYFDNLYASLYNIDNKSTSGSMKLNAKANLLGEGNIDLFVNFPFDKAKPSYLAGSIVGFNLPEINTMLTPSTNLKIESGNMEKLAFHFSFDEIQSAGEIELNYRDLKLVVFKESSDDKEEAKKDNLKSFIMNTFIFRTDMDEDVPEDKRTGTVGYERDNNRSIFNFWVKSLVSGIKSAYNLDKAEAKKVEREEKKEQRLSKREARKLRRAEKKRERG